MEIKTTENKHMHAKVFCYRDETTNRSSQPEVFCKKGVFNNFEKFTGVLKSVFNKVAGCRVTKCKVAK